MRSTIWLLIVIAALFASCRITEAQTVQVRVLDAHNGARIAQEKVSVFVKGEKGAREYTTDKEGNFTLPIDPSAYIYVATEWRVTCRTVKPGVVSYMSVATIMREGITDENTCGRAKSETIKGKLVIFARKASFFENFKR